MQRRWLIAIGAMGAWIGVVAVMSRAGSRAASEGAVAASEGAAASSSALRAAPEAAAARVERRFEVRRAAASSAEIEGDRARSKRAERARDATKELGVGAGIERIAASDHFSAFADRAKLDEDQRYALARILALHYENERNLAATHSEQERSVALQRQLLNDTRAQLRARLSMTDATWDAFERSGLLSTPPAEERGAAPAPEGDPT